jgi:hypothetical protein
MDQPVNPTGIKFGWFDKLASKTSRRNVSRTSDASGVAQSITMARGSP